jgi:hypothetical protein
MESHSMISASFARRSQRRICCAGPLHRGSSSAAIFTGQEVGGEIKQNEVKSNGQHDARIELSLCKVE